MIRFSRALAGPVTVAVAAAALAAAPADGQEWALGVEGGRNMSDLAGAGVEEGATEEESGFRGGVVVRHTFSPASLFAVQTGAAFSRKGVVIAAGDLNLDYLEMPLLLVVNLPLGDASVQPRLFGGGSFGFELDCELDPPGDAAASACAGTEIGETPSVDVGVRFGGGLDVRLQRDAAMILDVGWELGVTDLDPGASVELKNRNLYVSGGFMFLP